MSQPTNYETKYYLRIYSSSDNKLLLEACGVNAVCAFNLIKLYQGNRVRMLREYYDTEVEAWPELTGEK
jgi:hypothetical protein